MSDSAAAPAPAAEPVISIADVAKHATKKDAWMVIDGKVYNVTDFLEDHPGGPEIMMEHVGKDATQDFDDVGHSRSAREMLKKYYKGVLPEEERQGAKKSNVKASSVPGASAGGFLTYLVPIVVLGAAVWFQFLRPKADSTA